MGSSSRRCLENGTWSGQDFNCTGENEVYWFLQSTFDPIRKKRTLPSSFFCRCNCCLFSLPQWLSSEVHFNLKFIFKLKRNYWNISNILHNLFMACKLTENLVLTFRFKLSPVRLWAPLQEQLCWLFPVVISMDQTVYLAAKVDMVVLMEMLPERVCRLGNGVEMPSTVQVKA